MNDRSISAMALLLCLAGCWAPEAGAQVVNTSPDRDRSGTASSAYLLLPLTARTAGLGTAVASGPATMSGLEAAFDNPAGLMLNTGTNALFSRVEYVADIGVNYFGVARRIGSNNVAFTVSAWDFGDIPVQTEENPDVDATTPTWTATYVTAGLGYARRFTDRIAAGITAKVVSETMASDLNAATLAFDAGMTYDVGESGLRFGVSLKNFGPSMRYGGDGLIDTATPLGTSRPSTVTYQAEDFELPSQLNFGIAYTRAMGGAGAVTFLGNYRSNAYETDHFSGGVELGLRDVLYLRGGYLYEQNLDTNFFSGWNVGAGLNLEVSNYALTFDYAYRATDVFDGVHLITTTITL